MDGTAALAERPGRGHSHPRARLATGRRRSPLLHEKGDDEVERPVRHAGDSIRVVLGTASLGVTVALVRHGKVNRFEANLFRWINQMPPELSGPVWLVMQGGSLAAGFVTSGGAFLYGRRRLGRELLVSGVLAWLSAKLVKPTLGRGRPAVLLADVIVRYAPATGLGFPSGHAAVAAALATAAAPYLPSRYRRLGWTEAWLVAVARVYVGAHLPFDTLGGAALGSALAAALHLVSGAPGGEPPRDRVPRPDRFATPPASRWRCS